MKDSLSDQGATCFWQLLPHGAITAVMDLACDIPFSSPPPTLSLRQYTLAPLLPTPYLHHILCWSSFHTLLPYSRCQTSRVHSGSIGSLSLRRSLQESIPRDMRSRWRSLSEQDLKVILLGRSASEFISIACICSVLCCSLWGLLCSALLSFAGCGH